MVPVHRDAGLWRESCPSADDDPIDDLDQQDESRVAELQTGVEAVQALKAAHPQEGMVHRPSDARLCEIDEVQPLVLLLLQYHSDPDLHHHGPINP